ncbi:MAG: Maf family protein [Treponema sp.]|nr:Maf family protein [Treponema sp.]
MEPIILASGSLRRQEYFKLMGLPFSVMPAKIDETLPPLTNAEFFTKELAVKKVEKVAEDMRDRIPKWICGADTVISIEDKVFGKPKNREEASLFLRTLSGKKHNAVTSIALFKGRERKTDCRTVSCTVHFAKMADAEIEWYLDTNEWQGVAGAYRIQGLASCFITGIDGCPSTVVGLPLRDFYVMLIDNGYPYGG